MNNKIVYDKTNFHLRGHMSDILCMQASRLARGDVFHRVSGEIQEIIDNVINSQSIRITPYNLVLCIRPY